MFKHDIAKNKAYTYRSKDRYQYILPSINGYIVTVTSVSGINHPVIKDLDARWNKK